jgi:hypothetical protein
MKLTGDQKKKKTKQKTKTPQNKKLVILKKINKMDKPLANVTKMRREKTQISKIRSKKGEKITKEI